MGAIKSYEKALDVKKKVADKEDPGTQVRLLNDIAICCFKECMYDKALKACDDSLDINLADTEDSVKDKINTYTTMGSIHRRRLYFDSAVKEYKLANELHEWILGRDEKGLCVT